MCVAVFHFNVPLSNCFQVTGTLGRVITPKLFLSVYILFFFSLAVVAILDLVSSFPVEISPGGDASLKEDSIVVYRRHLMFSAFQESFCVEVLVFEHDSLLLLIKQCVFLWQQTVIGCLRLLWKNKNI